MLLAFGSNGSGQLGNGTREDTSQPKTVILLPTSKLESLHSLAAGGNHTILLLKDGVCLIAGSEVNGVYGHFNDDGATNTFQQLRNPAGISITHPWRLCSATWQASFLVSHDHQVYVAGHGDRGELGLGQDISSTLSLTRMPSFPPHGVNIVDLSSSMSHTIAVLSNGDVYGWGNGRKGQIGTPATNCWVPRKFERLPFKVERAVCGREFTCLFGNSTEGRIAVFGSDKWGILSDAPDLAPNWIQLGASWGNVYVLLRSGRLISWGRNDHGQLTPSELPPLTSFAAGSEHVIAITADGQVVSWGWGEHGNCGLPIDDNGNVAGTYNVVKTPSRAIAVAAGCATSWVQVESVTNDYTGDA